MKLGGSFGGYAFGPGENVHVSALEGLDGPAPRRDTNQDIASGGQLKGKDVRTTRSIRATFTLIEINSDDYEDRRAEFLAAVRESDLEQILLFDDSTRMVWASVDSVSPEVQTDRIQRTASVDVVFTAADPRVYGLEVTATVNGTPSTPTVGGNAETPGWLFTVDGPCVGPVFSAELASGETFTVGLLGQTIASGERLELDGRFDEVRVVTISTGEYRWNLNATGVGGRPAVLWPIAKGTPEVSFDSDSGASSGTLKIRPVL